MAGSHAGRRDGEGGREGIDWYRRAWERTVDAFPGINAATMLLLAGQAQAASELARAVRAVAEASTDAAAHWREATLGEAALLLGEAEVAAAHYRAAVTAARHQAGHIARMRPQRRILSARSH